MIFRMILWSIGALLERLDSLGLGEGKIELGEMDEFD